MKLSLLDLIPVHSEQSSENAVAATRSMARRADELGYHRYWFAEHHNMPAVASTTPAVIAAAVAADTDRIRVGSGGVMLPNHSPLIVAEQFAMLEAIAPGRIDLGIGRAPGSDPVITQLLRASGTTSDVDQFPEYIDQILALIGRDGASLRLSNQQRYTVRATPAASSAAEVWLLGSSQYSAALAAQVGLPYVFAHHFLGQGTEAALSAYRSSFTPSLHGDQPRTLLTVNVSVADTSAEANARATPNLHQMSRLRTGKPLVALDTVEDAEARELDAAQRQVIDVLRASWVIGDPEHAAADIQALATRHQVDEVMLSVAAAPRRDEPMDCLLAREHAIELLAKQLL